METKEFQSINTDTTSSTNSTDQIASFIYKISLANTTYNYSDKNKDAQQKDERLKAINELIEMLNNKHLVASLFIPHLDLLMDMLYKNIFRPLPSLKQINIPLTIQDTGVDPLEQESDPSWPHIKGIYEIFLQLLCSEECSCKHIKSYITTQFLSEFLQLFDSEESEERFMLKMILCRLYATVVPRRKMIRKAMTDCLSILIHEIPKFNGASEVLELLAFNISGFTLPLREEHVRMFHNIIIPLLKVQTCNLYFDQLIRCSMMLITKDNSLALPLLEGILKYWPFGNYAKEKLFLNELANVVTLCDVDKHKPVIGKLFKRLVRCIAERHVEVADRAMKIFYNECFLQIIKRYKTLAFGILVPVISELSCNHWDANLRNSCTALNEMLHKIDPQAYDNALDNAEIKKYDKSK